MLRIPNGLGVLLAVATTLTQVGMVRAAPAIQAGPSSAVTPSTSVCTPSAGESQPVGAALSEFFCAALGVDYATIQSLHSDGFGYGEIAQASFMAEALGGGVTPQAILDAKRSGDYSKLGLPTGTTVENWGQLMKLVLAGETKSLTNLGAIMSGRAQPSSSTTAGNHGHGNNGNHGPGGDHGQSGNHTP